MISKNINIRMPEIVILAMKKHLQENKFSEFIRYSVAEKLNRDFGEKIEISMRLNQGARTDLKDESARAKKLPILRERARLAREARRNSNKK